MAISAGKAASGGAAAGAGGILAVFQLADVKHILTNTGSPISMLVGLAIFSALALFAAFAYAGAVQADGNGAGYQKWAVRAFAIVFVLAVLALIGSVFVQSQLRLTTNFRDYADVNGFKFSSDLAGPESMLNATINDGNPHGFNATGSMDLLFTIPAGKITIDVEGLKDLKKDYLRVTSNYKTLLDRQIALQQKCDGELSAHTTTDTCADILRALIPAAARGSIADGP